MEIVLQFNKADTRLAGNSYGRKVFEDQVRDKIQYNQKNIIIFPNNIEKVASSFVQGFFAEIVKMIGYEKFDDVIEIHAKSEELARRIKSDLIA